MMAAVRSGGGARVKDEGADINSKWLGVHAIEAGPIGPMAYAG